MGADNRWENFRANLWALVAGLAWVNLLFGFFVLFRFAFSLVCLWLGFIVVFSVFLFSFVLSCIVSFLDCFPPKLGWAHYHTGCRKAKAP